MAGSGNNMNGSAKSKGLVSIGQAAEILGVSIDTIRRWDKAGQLHSTRPDGKNRYFSVDELEKKKLQQPLPISEAAQLLKISPSTLRRLEDKGLISPIRNGHGERLYDRKTLESFLNSEYFLRQKSVEDEIIEPLKSNGNGNGNGHADSDEPKQAGVGLTTRHLVTEHHASIHSLKRRLLVSFGALAAVMAPFILLIAFLTGSFLINPESTAKKLNLRTSVVEGKLKLEKLPDWKDNLRPFVRTALFFVSLVDDKKYAVAVQDLPFADINSVFTADSEGRVESIYVLSLDSSKLVIADKGLIENLNSELVQGKEPGQLPGNLAILPVSGGLGGEINDGTITTSDLANGAVTSDKLAPGVSVGGDVINTTNITNQTINQTTTGGGSGISEVVAGSGLTGGGTSGSITLDVGTGAGITVGSNAISIDASTSGTTTTISSNSGLEVSGDGLRLLGGCANNQILKWDSLAQTWNCAVDSAGVGGANSFETINAPAGTDPVADSATDTLNLTVTGTNLTLTGNSTTDTLDFDVVESALAGNGLVVNGDALDISTGNGLELSGDAVRVNQNFSFGWTADHTWTLAGAEDLAISHDGTGGTVDGVNVTLTPSSTAGTLNSLVLSQASSTNTNGLDAALRINNLDNDALIGAAIQIANSGGGNYTSIFDILGTLLSASEVTVLDAGISESEVSGEIEAVTAGNGLAGGGTADSVTLDVASANGGIVVNLNDIALTVQASADALSSTTSSGSGLEILSGGLSLLQGCSDTQILKWNETTDVWVCQADADTDTQGNAFTTIDTPAGTDPTADSPTDSLQLVAIGSNFTITGANDPESITFDISEATLAGTGLGVSGDSLVVNTASGVTTSGDNVVLDVDFAPTWTNSHTWTLAGTEDLDVTSDLAGTVDMLALVGTPSASVGTTRGIFIQQGAHGTNTNGLDNAIHIDNADTDLVITTAISVQNSGGGNYTNVFDILGTLISATEFNVLDNEIALGTETSGAYVSTITAGSGLTGDASGETSTPTLAVVSANGGIVANPNDIALTVQASADALSSTTSSGSGLEILSGGLSLLQGCADTQILKWNETTDAWACQADVDTDTQGNAFETINAPSGTDPVADSSTDTLNLTVTGANLTITGTSGTDTLDFDISESTLAGTGLGVSGDALVVNTAAGVTTSGDNVVVDQNFSFAWTADHTWTLAGAEDLAINHDGTGGTVDGVNVTITPSSTAGTLNSLVLSQAASGNTNGLDAALRINNLDNDTLISAAIQFANTGGGNYTTIFDILGTLLSASEVTVLDAGITESEVTGEIEAVTAGNGLTGGGTADSVTLDVASANGGIAVNLNDIALTLQGCSDTQILKWNETSDIWECQADADTDTQGNAFTTIDTPAGTDPTADSATDTLQLVATGTNLTITGANDPESITFDISESTLAGTGLGTSGDGLVVNVASGVTTSGDNVVLDVDFAPTWTNSHTWTLAGTEDLAISHDLVGTINVLNITGTPNGSANTANGLYIDQADSTNGHGFDAALVIDNSDTNLAITNGIQFIDAGGGFTNLFNVAGTLISATEFNVLDAEITLGTETAGDYVATVTGGNGLTGLGTGEGSTPTLAVGAGTCILANTDDVALNQNCSVAWTADHTWTLAGTEDLDVTSDLDGAVDMLALVGTPSGTAATTRGILLQQADHGSNTNGLDEALTIDNADADLAITTAIRIQNSGGGNYTNVFDILGTLLSASEVQALDGGISLGSETNNDYVAIITAGNGLTGDASGEGSTPTLAVGAGNGIVVAADSVAIQLLDASDGDGGTSSRSGLEFGDSGSNELTLLQGCGQNEILKWDNDTDVRWECATDNAGGVTDGDKGDITVTASGATWTIDPDSVALGTDTTGNYVASTNTSALTGLTGGSGGSEGATLTLGLDYSQALSGNVDLAANAAVFGQSGLVFEGATGGAGSNNETYISVTDPTADRTITIPDRSGTLVLSGDTFTGDVTATLDTDGSTALTIAGDSVALGTDTTGNYVASANTSVLTGLTGGSAGSEGAALSLAFDYSQALSGNIDLAANAAVFGQSGLVFEGSTGGAGSNNETFIAITDPTADRTITVPDRGGTLILSGDTFTGDVTATLDTDGSTALTIATDSVALTTDTTGNYVSSATASGGLTLTGGEGASLGIDLSSADGVGGTGSGSGLELDANGVGLLQGCGQGEILKWDNDTDVQWECAADSAGGVTDGDKGDITVTASGSTWTIDPDSVALGTDTTGNYVASTNTSVLTGLTGGSAGSEGANLTIGLDYSQALSGDVGLAADAAIFGVSGLIFEGSTANTAETFISVTNPTADRTITIPDRGGTLVLSGDTFTGDVTATLDTDGSTALTIAGDSVALGTDTTGNYVASANTSTLTGLTGGSAGSEGASLSLAFDYSTALSGDVGLAADNAIFGVSGLIFEGSTANTAETFFSITNPTADRTFTFPDRGGTISLSGDTFTGDVTGTLDTDGSTALTIQPDSVALTTDTTGNYVASANTSVLTGLSGGSAGSEGAALSLGFDYSQALSGDVGLAANAAVFGQSGLVFEGATANLLETFISVTDPTADRTVTIPDRSGTVSLSGDTFTGDVTATLDTDGSTALTIAANSVALTTDTTGDYVSSATASGGLTLTGTEGGSLGIDLSSADGTGSTGSGSGLELDANGVGLLQGCGEGEILKWDNNTDVQWECAADNSGGVSDGDKGDITVTASGATWTIDPDSVALGTDTTGNYVESTNTSVLTGLTGGSAGSEGADLTIGLDYSTALSGDVGLAADAAIFGASGLIFEGSTANTSETFISVTNPTADRTITIPDRGGTLVLSGDTFTGDVTATLDTDGSTALTIAGDSVALGTDTTGNYVESANTSTLTGLTGGSAGSEGADLTLAFDYSTALSGDVGLAADNAIFGVSGLIFEGSTANTAETFISVTNPTADRTITIPDRGGTIVLSGDTFTGDVTATLDTDGSTALTIAGDSVALTTDTTGNYVSSATASGGLTLTGTEGASLGIDLSSADGTGATGSGSGLEIDANGVGLLQGCAQGEILKWDNDTDVQWECAADAQGAGGSPTLNSILAADGAGTAQDSNANSIFWNWDFTSAAVDSGLTISESSASTSGTQDQQALLELVTLSSSTASPLQVTAAGTDVADVWFNLSGSSDFEIRDGGTAFATFADTGAITFAPTSGEDVIMNFAGNGRLDINPVTYENNLGAVDIVRTGAFTGVNTETANELRIAPGLTLTEPASGQSFTWNGANIDMSGIAVTDTAGATSTLTALRLAGVSDADASTVMGLNVDNITNTAASERGVRIGTGWSGSNGDADLVFEDTTPVIRLGATDNTSDLRVTDSNATPNTLFRVAEVATDNFNKTRVSVGSAGNGLDQFYVDGRINSSYNMQWGDCLFDHGSVTGGATLAYNFVFNRTATTNGISHQSVASRSGVCRLTQSGTAAASSVGAWGSGSAAVTERSLNPVFETVILSDANTDHRNLVGFSDVAQSSAISADTNNAANEAFFRKQAAGTSWQAVTRAASGTETVTSSLGSTNAWRTLRIEIDNTAAAVRFYVDGTLSATHSNGSVPGSTTRLGYHISNNNTTVNVGRSTDMDYLRFWSDDPPGGPSPPDQNEQMQEAPLAIDSTQNIFDARQFLTELSLNPSSTEYDPSQRLDTAVMVASQGIVAPQVVTNGLLTNTIEAASAEDIQINSDVVVSGTLTVDKIRANQIEGLEIFTNKISSLEGKLAGSESPNAVLANSTDTAVLGESTETSTVVETDLGNVTIQSATIALDLNVNGMLTASAGLTVNGLAEFNGESIFDKLVTFNDKSIFKGETTFEGRTIFNSDSGGFAIIKPGQTEIEVKFDKPYEKVPVVTLNIKNGLFAQYAYKDLSENGFTIVLKELAEVDVEFAWTAMSVKDARISQNPQSPSGP